MNTYSKWKTNRALILLNGTLFQHTICVYFGLIVVIVPLSILKAKRK